LSNALIPVSFEQELSISCTLDFLPQPPDVK